ncbi:IS3 family transposase [Marinococcus halotolerans]|nr:IS3 family transposase [Marinococcus halotolerans]
MEGFFGTLKCEEYYLPDSFYATYEDLVDAIRRYIGFYNHQRYQEHLNGLTPIEYRNQAA